MTVNSYEELKKHIGHDIVCVGYSHEGDDPFVNVAIECETCNEVLMDFDEDEV